MKGKLKIISCFLLVFALTATIFIQPVNVNANTNDVQASGTIIINPSYNKSTERLSVNGKVTNGGNINVTIKIISPSGKLLYIDEVKSNSDGSFVFAGPKTSDEGTYKIYVGSEITDQAEMVTFSVSKTIPEDPEEPDPGAGPGTNPDADPGTKPGTGTGNGDKDDEATGQINEKIDEAIENIADSEPDEAVNALHEIIKQSGKLAQEDKNKLNEKMEALIDKTIRKISALDVNKLAEEGSNAVISEDDNKVKVEISDEAINNAIEALEKSYEELESTLRENGFNSIASTMQQKNKKVITIASQESDKEQELVLSVKSISDLSDKGISLKMDTKVSFELTPGSVDTKQILKSLESAGREDIDEDSINSGSISISLKELDKNDMEQNSGALAIGEMSRGNATFEQVSRSFDLNLMLLTRTGNEQSTVNLSEFKKKLLIQLPLDELLLNDNNVDVTSKKLGVYRFDSEKNTWVYVGGKIDPQTGMISFETNHLSIYAAFDYNKTYKDIQKTWAKEYIEILSARQIVSGVNDDLFQPDRNITRAEFAKMLVEALGLTGTRAASSFTDVKEGAWYYDYVATAQSLKIINGLPGNNFDPEGKINRQDMAVMAYRALNAVGLSLAETKEYAEFSDNDDISDFAEEAVKGMQMAGILEGSGDGAFKPLNNSTRAEAAKVIYMIIEAIK